MSASAPCRGVPNDFQALASRSPPVSAALYGEAPESGLARFDVFEFPPFVVGKSRQAAIIGAYDFSKFRRIADIGGGEGGLLSAVLEAAPIANGILFDQPRAVEAARRTLANKAVSDRIDFVAGDFFDAVPKGAELYVLKQILHDWDDEHAEKILATCRRSMLAGSRLLVLEMMIEPNVAFPKRLDLMMMAWTGGRERTQDQFDRIFAKTGFSLIGTRRTTMPICVLEAQPA